MIRVGFILNALKAFEAAARLGSIHEAARELSVTDGAVSRQIIKLETVLGVTLFERGNRMIKLTPHAARYAEAISEAFAAVDRSTEHLLRNSGTSTFIIAAPDSFLLRWLIPRLKDLEQKLPNTSIRLTSWNRSLRPNDPSIDLFVGVGQIPSLGGMKYVKLAPETFGPVVNPLLLKGHENDNDFLWHLPRLAQNWPSGIWNEWARSAGIELPPLEITRYEQLFFALQAAEAGLGVAIGPIDTVADALMDGRLVAPLGMAHLSGFYFLAWRCELPSMRMNAVSNWFSTEFQKSALPWFQNIKGRS